MTFTYLISKSQLFQRFVTLIIATYKYSYLMMNFLLINIYGSSVQRMQTKIFIRRPRMH